MPQRYAELTPDELEAAFAKRPLAIVPWGALEWHGPHLPLGLDGIVAEWFAEHLADRTEGVLLPGCWMPITTLPHPASLQIRTEALRMILGDLLGGLYGAGARVVCLITGHYAQGHEIELYDGAHRAIERYKEFRVLAAAPLEVLGDDSLLDHAARSETAQLLAIRPELVNVSALPANTDAKHAAVLGENPRLASAEEGATLLERALSTWTEWVNELVVTPDTEFLRGFYERRKRDYAPYVKTYFVDSWEQAILDWWLTLEGTPKKVMR